MVVPEHDLVRGVLGVGAAADEREDVAAEEHFSDADAPVEVCANSGKE